MIEIYIENHNDPEAVEKTVKELGYNLMEHAGGVTCVYVTDNKCVHEFVKQLDVIHVRGE